MHYVEAKGILSAKNGMNIYRGCSHGCIYCDSRSKCYGMNHQFEDIEVKINAPELLEKRLSSKHKKCMIGTGAMCDPYLHIEKELQLTRQCLEIALRRHFGMTILTKSDLILRDINLLQAINEDSKCVVQMTITCADDDLCKIIEPNVCPTSRRLEVLMECKRRGIPTMVWVDPILPFIDDTKENIQRIMDMCVDAEVKGVVTFGVGLTLREGNREYFYEKIDQHFPGIKEKYIATYGDAYELPAHNSDELMAIIRNVCKAHGMMYKPSDCFEYLNEYPEKYEQLSIFDLT